MPLGHLALDTTHGLSCPQRIDPLLLVVAIAVLTSSRQVDPHWKRGIRFLRIGLAALQMAAADAPALRPEAARPTRGWS